MIAKIQQWYLNLTPIQKSILKDAIIWIPLLISVNVALILGVK